VSQPDLVIVLSSFNGRKFITDQINSIRRQTYVDWTLLVRDDGSSDNTVALVQSLAKEDSRIRLLRDSSGNLGPPASFGVLLSQALDSGTPYVAIADQDDVWLPTKLAREMELLRHQEAAAGAATPLLVHSDLAVVREDLSLLHRSFLEFQGIRHQSQAALPRLLVQNFVTGSTVVLNRALLEVAVPVPPVIMHDWWLALCAAALGRLLYLPEATVLYRQHGSNAQGSQGRWAGVVDAVRRPLTWWSGSAGMLDRTISQGRELAQRIEQRRPEALSAPMLREFCAAFGPHGSAAKRLRVVYHHRIQPRSFLPYPVPYYARVLLWGGDVREHQAGLPVGQEQEPQRGAPARS
jgi:GT2 family glycosyltransferase